jgi:hypothetical protein
VGFLQSFSSFFDSVYTLPGELRFDYTQGQYLYKFRDQIEAEQPEKRKKTKTPQWQDLSEEEWQEIHQQGEEPHMPT